MDEGAPSSLHGDSGSLAGELAARLARQIDLVASAAASSSSRSKRQGDDDQGDDDDEDNDEEDAEEDGDDDDYEDLKQQDKSQAGLDAKLTSTPEDAASDASSDSGSRSSSSASIAAFQSTPALIALQSSLQRMRSSPLPRSYSKLKHNVQEAFNNEMELRHAQTILSAASTSASTAGRKINSAGVSTTSSNIAADDLVWTVNAHLTASAYASVLDGLIKQAEQVKEEELYWQSIEGRARYSVLYLVQTMPLRIANALRVLLDRLHYLASSPRPPSRLISYTAIKRALPPSLLLTSLFPHLSRSGNANVNAFALQATSVNTSSPIDASSTKASPSSNNKALSHHHSLRSARSLFFLSLSPLMLTRQEVSLKRRQLRTLRYELAKQIGGMVRDAERGLESLTELQDGGRGSNRMQKLGSIMGERVAYLESTMTKQTGAGEDDTHSATVAQAHSLAYDLRNPNELLLSLQQTVYKSINTHSDTLSARIHSLSRPSRLTRAWPWLVTVPLGSYLLISKVYNSRMTIYNYYTYAKDTVKGFLMDWVVSPTRKILETLRHGDDGLSLMGRESLKSDFDSLERMVVQFAKDQRGGKLSQEDLVTIGRNVRQGDLSVVLGAYEQDLKSPLKSAVAGTLVRTLLIQVQKVKVDVDLAMDGIEKMLKSQQLTFAFVGVAPSMVLLYLTSTWAKRALSVGESSSSKSARKKVWYTLRNIDRLLTTTLDSPPAALSDQTVGLLLIELTVLRKYAKSAFFPTRDRSVRDAFLEDVRDLERDRGIQSRLRTYDRIMRVWEGYVRG